MLSWSEGDCVIHRCMVDMRARQRQFPKNKMVLSEQSLRLKFCNAGIEHPVATSTFNEEIFVFPHN